MLRRFHEEYRQHLQVLQADDSTDEPTLRRSTQYSELRLAGLAQQRATVIRLRDEQQIDDTVLRQLQRHLDLEEVRHASRSQGD